MLVVRVCSRCGYPYKGNEIEVMFQRRPDVTRNIRAVCVVCLQTDGDQVKQRNRFLAKARSTIWRHAQKYGMEPAEFCERYGWSVSELAHDLEYQYGNGCAYCRGRYEQMGYGLQDITVDIQDPLAEPYYATNVKLCCGTCNKAKGKLSPDKWELKRRLFRVVLRWRAEHVRPTQLSLF
jgi:hypothetical protein